MSLLRYAFSRLFAGKNRSYVTNEHRHIREYFLGQDAVKVTDMIFMISVTVLAMYVAYNCNKASGKYNPIAMAIVAGIFPEIYLVQCTARSLVNKTYTCSK